LSRSECSQIVESILSEISDALVSGEDVKLSSFGSFVVRQKNGRIGRNPKTGKEVPIEPRRVLAFRASHVLKEKINKLAGLSE
jgi:integration host factor subunit alpha